MGGTYESPSFLSIWRRRKRRNYPAAKGEGRRRSERGFSSRRRRKKETLCFFFSLSLFPFSLQKFFLVGGGKLKTSLPPFALMLCLFWVGERAREASAPFFLSPLYIMVGYEKDTELWALKKNRRRSSHRNVSSSKNFYHFLFSSRRKKSASALSLLFLRVKGLGSGWGLQITTWRKKIRY